MSKWIVNWLIINTKRKAVGRWDSRTWRLRHSEASRHKLCSQFRDHRIWSCQHEFGSWTKEPTVAKESVRQSKCLSSSERVLYAWGPTGKGGARKQCPSKSGRTPPAQGAAAAGVGEGTKGQGKSLVKRALHLCSPRVAASLTSERSQTSRGHGLSGQRSLEGQEVDQVTSRAFGNG